jgi:hypothetical protein
LSVSGAGILSPKKWNDKFDIDLIMSLKLLLLKSDKSEINNKLYDVIFNKLLKNKNLIKDGGYMSIYYISNKVNGNIKEG